MPPPPETLVLAALVVAGAFVIFGITGFGSTIIAAPLLAHAMPLKFVIPMFALARPGGNVTGQIFFVEALSARGLELLKETVPGLARVAVLRPPDNPASRLTMDAITRDREGLLSEDCVNG